MKVDAFGLVGQMLDEMVAGRRAKERPKKSVKHAHERAVRESDRLGLACTSWVTFSPRASKTNELRCGLSPSAHPRSLILQARAKSDAVKRGAWGTYVLEGITCACAPRNFRRRGIEASKRPCGAGQSRFHCDAPQ
jgi:hypothetical protein